MNHIPVPARPLAVCTDGELERGLERWIPRGRLWNAARRELDLRKEPTMKAKRYRPRSDIELSAIQFTGDNAAEIWDEFGAAGIYGPSEINPDHLLLTTISGDRVPCRAGDWVIPEEVPGRFYPCDQATFARKYEEVPEQ